MRLLGGLAIGLALLTAHQVTVWQQPVTLWEQAHAVAPRLPRPAVNRAIASLEAHDGAGAEHWLDVAAVAAETQTGAQRAVSLDIIDTNRAVLRIATGRFAEARALLVNPDGFIGKQQVCRAWGQC